MILFPNCKINIGLRIIERREDGYHNLQTLFYPVRTLTDELKIEKASVFSFQQDGFAIDCKAEDNLVARVYRHFVQQYGVSPVAINLVKNIPFGAGLGGGSSDAAHTAIALNQLFSLNLTKEQLAREVVAFGADCPFFIYSTPCYAEGIGDKLTPFPFHIDGYLVIVKPNVNVSTAEAYRGIVPHNPSIPLKDSLKAYESYKKNSDNSKEIINDFEETVFPKYPIIARTKRCLLELGAKYASMSGSGASVFAIFKPGECPSKEKLNTKFIDSFVHIERIYGEEGKNDAEKLGNSRKK